MFFVPATSGTCLYRNLPRLPVRLCTAIYRDFRYVCVPKSAEIAILYEVCTHLDYKAQGVACALVEKYVMWSLVAHMNVTLCFVLQLNKWRTS
jgi:hypothetical protein